MKVGLVCPYSWDVPGGVRSHVADLAGPEDRAHGDGVEAVGVEHGGLIVIPQNRQLGFFHHEFQAFDWVGAIAHDITQTDDLIDRLRGDVGKNCV